MLTLRSTLGAAFLTSGLLGLACNSEAPEPDAPEPTAAPVNDGPEAGVPPKPAVEEGPPPPARATQDAPGLTEFNLAPVANGAFLDLETKGLEGDLVPSVRAKGSACKAEDGKVFPSIVLELGDKELERWVLGPKFKTYRGKPIAIPKDGAVLRWSFADDIFIQDKCDRNGWVESLGLVSK